MIPIISFIGWHDVGKTTVARQVVSHLKEQGLRVAVIKSTKNSGIEFDRPGSDTDTYKKAGADAVSLMAPDQFFFSSSRPNIDLIALIHRFFRDYDIVIGEGFKHERKIPKIEVVRGDADLPRNQVYGIIATVTDQQITGSHIFRFDESKEIADFIINRYIKKKEGVNEKALLQVNGKRIPMKGFVQDALTGTILGFVKTLKQTDNIKEIDIRIKLEGPE